MQVSNQLDQDGFTQYETPQCREDRNTVVFLKREDLRKNLVRRSRAVLGFRGVKTNETILLDGNALQHAERVLWRSASADSVELSEIKLAELAKHIASETQYWG